jgi:hypothetical protein
LKSAGAVDVVRENAQVRLFGFFDLRVRAAPEHAHEEGKAFFVVLSEVVVRSIVRTM